MKKFFPIIISILLLACSGNKENQAESTVNEELGDSTVATGFNTESWDSYMDVRNYLVEGDKSADSVQAIEQTSAILVFPSEKRLNEFYMATGDENDFSIVTNGHVSSMKNAGKLFANLKVDTIRANKRYLKLVGKTKTWLVDTQKANSMLWYSIGFKPGKVPQIRISGTLDSLTAATYFN